MRIICSDPANLTGQVGSVPFVKGEASTDDESMLAFFSEHPERFEVHEDDDQEQPEPVEPADPGTPAPPADPYDDMTDEQVAEAYATNVGGEATSRKGQIKRLRELDAENTDQE